MFLRSSLPRKCHSVFARAVRANLTSFLRGQRKAEVSSPKPFRIHTAFKTGPVPDRFTFLKTFLISNVYNDLFSKNFCAKPGISVGKYSEKYSQTIHGAPSKI